ncbi:MAG: hypothetical protein KAJ78_01815 [Acidobacteria bacterium]|nr:hypothetical protein [Acidobacteriota bacterium]
MGSGLAEMLAHEIRPGVRLLAGLPSFLRHPLDTARARQVLDERNEARSTAFLDMVDRRIFEHGASPYRTLLSWAGCELGDIKRLVADEGVEGALTTLHESDVYLTVDELKGRRPIVRGSRCLEVSPHDFLNPELREYLGIRTSGSRGPETVVPVDLGYIHGRAVNLRLDLEAVNGLAWHQAIWGLPGTSALVHLLELAACGAPPVRWFSHVDPREPGLHARYRRSTSALRWTALLAGRPLPAVQLASVQDPEPVLRWMAEVLKSGETPHLITYVSSAVRLCCAARERGYDLAGSRLTITGEPVTAARMATIREAGVEARPRYGSTESGSIGYGCLRPEHVDEVHVLHDRVAVIQEASSGGLFVSSLLATTPYLLFNVSLGDQAVMTERNCGCPLQTYGWRIHLHSIRSPEKTTCGGMCFLDVDLARVIDDVLPKLFGGEPTQYQLMETQETDGRPGLCLRVDPAVGEIDDAALAAAFLDAIGPGQGMERMMGTVLRDHQLLRIERLPPLSTPSGKILHLCISPSQSAPGSAD